MMPQKSRKPVRCTYCRRKATTEDHVPPKCLFATRCDLITVPSCGSCNSGASKDDEYFRLAITSRLEAGNHAEVQAISPRIHRSLERPQARGFKQQLLNNMMPVEVASPGGILLGVAPGYNVNLRRLDRVVARVVKGLFFHELEHRLSTTYEAVAYAEDGLRDLDAATRDRLREYCGIATSQLQKNVGRDVFSYWHVATQEDSNATFWVMTFYKSTAFIALTGPRDKLPPKK
jgi:hypothetical protein